MTRTQIPNPQDMLWPTLKALEALGGSASIQEISDHIALFMGLSDDAMNVLQGAGLQSKVDYRAAWARTGLKRMGAVENISRGVWAITDLGRSISSDAEVRKLDQGKIAESNRRRASTAVPDQSETSGDTDDHVLDEQLLNILRSLDPGAFERLCQRLLRQSGFIKVEVTGRSGDGGIDGTGILRIELVSFHIIFQCKRYSGSVGAPEIRAFRGAMVGRADKGLFMTTGRFTRDAEREAVRDGAAPIDLIDGLELCRLMKDAGLGITTIEIPDEEFFRSI